MEKNKTDSTLAKDIALRFPNAVLLKASAGSGKTHALSLRFVQFLLSAVVGKNDLANILAITFTKNASREMKTRILKWLKDCYFEDEREAGQVLDIVSLSSQALAGRAEEILENILTRYTDFQVETIDSFTASIFKASTLDLGFPPYFEIVLDNSDLIEYAFNRYLRRVRPGSRDGETFREIIDLILASQGREAYYPWDPSGLILDKLKSLYVKLAAQKGEPARENFETRRVEIQKKIEREEKELQALIGESGLEPNTRSGFYSKVEPAIASKKFSDLIGASFKTKPVKNPTKRASRDAASAFDEICCVWEKLEALTNEYRYVYAREFFQPYLMAYESFAETLEQVKHRRETVFIEDINKRLAGYIDQMIIPDIYFRLGDRIFHFLVDEFQDTSPIQWTNMRPLIENSLAVGGSFFAVGDTKQAIFGFREADYRIMKEMEEQPAEYFGSAEIGVRELDKNYRSFEKILEFTRGIFPKKLNEFDEYRRINEGAAGSGEEEDSGGSKESGDDRKPLYEFEQEVVKENRGKGFVDVVVLERGGGSGEEEGEAQPEAPDAPAETKTDEAENEVPEKAEIQRRVEELRARGYQYSDIAILTYRNESVVNVAAWLNEKDIPFIPYSSLDIRTRKTTGELMALLRFLDSPPDDLSFSVFLLGDVLRMKMEQDGVAVPPGQWNDFLFDCRRKDKRPIYVAFRSRYPELWERYFDRSFRSVGYYPLYDLVTLIYRVFNVFERFPEEEAGLAKLMESIKDFESLGRNDLREFLKYAEQSAGGAWGGGWRGRSGGAAGSSQEAAWNIDVPLDIDAVKIMTIHKAKGLGFPVVILLLYGESYKPPEFFIETDDESVRVYKINKGLAEAHRELKRIYEDTRLRDDVNRLNTLYVALTRAKEELHVVGVKSKRSKYPFDLIEAGRLGEPQPKVKEKARPAQPEAGMIRFAEPFEIAANPRAALNFENIRRGNLAHEILAELEYVPGGSAGWESGVAGVVQKMRPREWEQPLYESVGRAVAEYFEGPGSPLAEYFEEREGRRVLREFNYCDAGGNLYRMDRVVLDADAITIIDFKTGFVSEKERRQRRDAEDREQMCAYIGIIREIYPGKPVRGILAHIDEKRAEAVDS
jgi:ATP-dependent exoDNAse (exonuclease V) beta subunit